MDTGPPATPPPLTAEVARAALFLGDPPDADQCQGDDARQIRCMLEILYVTRGRDARAYRMARALYDDFGLLAGVEEPHTMNGGYRGLIEIVPHVPVGPHKKHLQWVHGAFEDFERFFGGVAARTEEPIAFQWRPLTLRFMRSVGRTTPSAYAADWTIGFNVSGSLHRSADAVRETLFHEIFHLNDQVRGHWSSRALGPIHDGILAKCARPQPRQSTPCLRPFAPGRTMVKGGTFYAFQPGNGPEEYAAELALRYYVEQRAALAGKRQRAGDLFKCQTPANLQAWTLFKDAFFGGLDLTPPCKG